MAPPKRSLTYMPDALEGVRCPLEMRCTHARRRVCERANGQRIWRYDGGGVLSALRARTHRASMGYVPVERWGEHSAGRGGRAALEALGVALAQFRR